MTVRSERDYFSFDELGPQDWARKVKSYSGSIVSDVSFDEVQASYPSPESEQYAFFLSSNLQATVLITYTNNTKENIQSVVRS